MEIYHNPRCQKSRQALSLLEENKVEVKIKKYLVDHPSKQELASLIKKLGIRPLELIRKNEKLYKTEYKDQELSDDEWLDVLAENPSLIERPIFIKGDKAVIGRPPENVLTLL
ncbi:arsenate reductase (glutaredoxin) [Membranihabitans marinus]|nr:arsenate reductase (glutaredoxin) [Membranihabitans marinus]